jgi:hypothetical protein
MKRLESKYILAHPARRPLRIFASDPMLARTPGNRITIEIPNEPLQPGPVGSRFEVIDYDGAQDCFYPPVDLNDPVILMQSGLEPTESDPRFHQQMVYAVAMRTLQNFERALGRRLEFRQRPHTRLRLLPHAFHGANAYYVPELNAILFGYFRADRRDPGPNLPGQTVFTCLSHDIIVHELTHAVVDRLRRYFMEPSNPDVLAFHEGFSDIVALFQHFTFHEFLRDEIQKTRGDIRAGKRLVELASQFGYATGANRALRSAIDKSDKRMSPLITEVHERGSILVAAVFDAFFSTYQRRIRDLIRIATGGTGNLAEGDLHPDLVNRIALEATGTAQSILTMCIRAFDYLPPVDVTFGDYLRALVTADYELQPGDESGLRSAMIEAFRNRGIYAENVASLAEESLIWSDAPRYVPPLDHHKINWANQIALAATAFSLDPFQASEPEQLGASMQSALGSSSSDWGSFSSDEEQELKTDLVFSLHDYAISNADSLFLDRSKPIQVTGFHTVFRVAPGGQLLTELVVQYMQQDDTNIAELGGIPFRGGTTIVAGADGRIRYMIAKPLPAPNIEAAVSMNAKQRLDRQQAYLATTDLADAQLAYGSDTYLVQRAKRRMNITSLHQGVS